MDAYEQHRSNTLPVLVTVALLLVAAAGLGTWLLTRGGDDAAGSPRPSAPPATSDKPEPSWWATPCPPREATTMMVRGRLTNKIAFKGKATYATHPQYGPAFISPTKPNRCFDHSPMGAIFAATSAAAEGNVSASMQRQLLQHRTTYTGPMPTEYGVDPTVKKVIIGGYRLEEVTLNRIVVSVPILYRRSPTDAPFAAVRAELVWREGDWFIDDTKAIPIGGPNATAAGFTLWSGG